MLYFLLFNLLLVNSFSLKWDIPQGTIGSAGRILIEDTDRENNFEFIMRTYGGSQKIYFYELHLPDTWEVDSIYYPYYPLLWDIGDFDLDGFYDLAMQCGNISPYWSGISIIESPDSFSYPTQEVWRDTVGSALVTPICVYDIDKDSIPEIVKVLGDYIHLHIYESIGDNLYEKIAEITTSSTHNSSSTLAFGDFDLDGQNEFIWGYSSGEYSIWECTGNNSYQEIELQQLPTGNIKDCFTVDDADGDGKDEFVVKGYNILGAEVHPFIFEATGDNTYEIIKSFTLPGGDYSGGYSDAGDVDGDSIPEIVLEARQNVFIIKSVGDDSFYVWDSLPGNNSGSSVAVYDIDGNGLEEVVISGNDETRIYEWEEEGIEEQKDQRHKIRDMRLTAHPNPFTDNVEISWTLGTGQSASGENPITNDQCPMTISIYDVSGRLVKNFILNPSSFILPAKLVWDGKNSEGNCVKSGIYFLKLRASGEKLEIEEARKVIKIE
jgi:hypothetical protein